VDSVGSSVINMASLQIYWTSSTLLLLFLLLLILLLLLLLLVLMCTIRTMLKN